MDQLDEMSASGSGDSQEVTLTNQQSFSVPVYIILLMLGLRLVITMFIVPMAGWVLITIKSTRSLHKPHNIFVANLMATDIIFALTMTAVAIQYTSELRLLSCSVHKFLFFPSTVIHLTYLMIAADKVMAIAFPFKHKKVMKPRIVAGIITTLWIVAALFSMKEFFSSDDCLSRGVDDSFIRKIPIFLASFLAISLNVYLTIRAYKIHKQIQQETKLSGVNSQVVALKKKQAKVRKDLKPIITLLVVLFGNSSLTLLVLLLLDLITLLGSYQTFSLRLLVAPVIIYTVLLLHPIVYGLYFKQAREPMMKKLKRLLGRDKFNTAVVAPMPRRTAWM